MSISIETSPLPPRHTVRTIIEGLVGRKVEVRDLPPIHSRETNLVAAYVTDRGQVAAVIVIDLEAAARLGGALGMLPKAGVDETIEAGAVEGLLLDNTYEVLNVLSAAFNVEDAPHVRLHELYGAEKGVPNDVLSLAQLVGSRLDLELDIAGYGTGRLSIVCR